MNDTECAKKMSTAKVKLLRACKSESPIPPPRFLQHPNRAVEMPGPWKEWKTKPRFPTLPNGRWKSRRQREISTFPPPRLAAHGKLENQRTVSHFPTRCKR
jgi:hypothetical protein